MANATNIIEYMKNHHGITVQECTKKLGTTELRKEISKLRRKGYGIKSVWEEGVNKYGAKTRYYRYFLTHEPDMTKKFDNLESAIYNYNYMEMLKDLCMIRGETKKNDI